MADHAGEAHPLLTKAYRTRLLIVLALTSTLSFADRSVFSAVSQVVKEDLRFTDFQLGLLQGLGFAAVYAVAAIPIARLAERHSRVWIISLSVAAWSAMTAFSGMAVGFVHMLLARAGVGIGESGGSAPATSLISDHFPAARRGMANSIFLLGSPFGALIGALVGGWAAQNYGWRSAFYAMAVPGFIVAVLIVLLLREPPRGLADGAPKAATPPPNLWHVFKYLIGKRTFILVWIAGSLAAIGMSAVAQFMVPYLARTYQLSVQETAQFFGWISFASLGSGMLAGGFLSDLLSKRDKRWQVWAPAAGIFLAAPAYIVAFMMNQLWGTVIFLVLGAFLLFFYFAPTVAVVQNMATPRMRASAAAIFGLVFSTAGPGMGPTIMGLLSDMNARRLFTLGDFETLCRGGVAVDKTNAALMEACRVASAGGLRESMLMLLTTVFLLSGVFYLLAAKTLEKDAYRPEEG